MIEYKEFLRIPGPTPITQTVRNATNTPMIYHRSELFGKRIGSIIENGRKVFKTPRDILIFSATGREVIEASIFNFISSRKIFFSKIYNNNQLNYLIQINYITNEYSNGNLLKSKGGYRLKWV